MEYGKKCYTEKRKKISSNTECREYKRIFHKLKYLDVKSNKKVVDIKSHHDPKNYQTNGYEKHKFKTEGI